MDAVIRWQSTENAVPELLRKGLPAWSHFRCRDEKLLSFWSTNSRYPHGLAGWLAGWLVDQHCGEGQIYSIIRPRWADSRLRSGGVAVDANHHRLRRWQPYLDRWTSPSGLAELGKICVYSRFGALGRPWDGLVVRPDRVCPLDQ